MTPCPKCHGLLVDDPIVDHSTNPPTVSHAVRCVNCGFFKDRLMLENHGEQRKMPGKKPWYRNIGT